MTRTGGDPQAGGTARRKLPIGIRTFLKIREEGWYYVDKTSWAGRLVDQGGHGVSKVSRLSRFSGLDNLVPELSRDARNVAAFEVEAG